MKRFILIIAAITMLVGCQKEQVKSYTFVDNFGGFEYLVDELGSSMDVEFKVVFKEYDSNGLPIKIESVDNPKRGVKFSFNAAEGATYVTVGVSIRVTYDNADPLTVNKYSAVVYILKDRHNDIVFDEDTYYQSSEPKVTL